MADPTDDRDQQVDEDMAEADTANGERSPDADDVGDEDGVNDTESRYGDDESPA